MPNATHLQGTEIKLPSWAAVRDTVQLLLIVGGLLWAAARINASVDILHSQMVEQTRINQQQTETLAQLAQIIAVIQSDHEKYVMPHIMKDKAK